MRAPFRRMLMCHMLADTHEELLAMADLIGLHRKWIQDEGTYREHFDICLSLRVRAVAAGAVEIEYGTQLGEILLKKKIEVGLPEEEEPRWL